jgi:hypothetical protein
MPCKVNAGFYLTEEVDFRDVSLAFCFNSDNFNSTSFAMAITGTLQVQMGYQLDTSHPRRFFQSSGYY